MGGKTPSHGPCSSYVLSFGSGEIYNSIHEKDNKMSLCRLKCNLIAAQLLFLRNLSLKVSIK